MESILPPSAAGLVATCFSLVPVPYLHAVFIAFRHIWSSVQRAQESQRQLQLLGQYIATLLHTLDTEYRAGRLNTSTPSDAALAQLTKWVVPIWLFFAVADMDARLLTDISSFMQEQATYNFLKTLYVKEKRISKINGFIQQIAECVTVFQVREQIHLLVDVLWIARVDIVTRSHFRVAVAKW